MTNINQVVLVTHRGVSRISHFYVNNYLHLLERTGMKRIENQTLVGERALFASQDIVVLGSVFCDGESPLKESRNIEICSCRFEWKYPLWYCRGVRVTDCYLSPTARSGIWYTQGLSMSNCKIDAPKTFRRCQGLTLSNVELNSAQETLWNCIDVSLSSVYVRGDYFGMGTSSVVADGLRVEGNYIFDGGRDITVKNSRLISKDAFWNTENVTVIDSVIIGEYLGWNSKNLRLINCYIESDQGMCYIEDLVLDNCQVKDSPLSFEYSTVSASFKSLGNVSIKNPISGIITVEGSPELIMEEERVDISATEIRFITKDESI